MAVYSILTLKSVLQFLGMVNGLSNIGFNYPSGRNLTSLQKLVSMVTRRTPSIVVVDAAEDHLEWVTVQVQEDGRLVTLYQYNEFKSFLKQHIRDFSREFAVGQHGIVLSFILTCSTKCIESSIQHATELDNTVGLRSLLRHFSTWLIITSNHTPNLNTTLDNVALVNLRTTSVNSEVSVSTLMWGSRGREWSQVEISGDSDEMTHSTLFPNTQTGLNGRQLIVGTVPWTSRAIRSIINGTVVYSGSGIDAIDLFSRKFNFTYAVVEPDDMLWGSMLQNGSATGVLGMIKRAEVDICPVAYVETLKRSQIMSFTHTMQTSVYKAVYVWKKNEDKSWLYLLNGFNWRVYLLGCLTFIVVLVLLFPVLHMNTDVSIRGREAFAYSLGSMVKGFLHQDIQEFPTSVSARVILCTWCLFVMIMTAIYTSNLVATSTVGDLHPPFNTLEQLAERDDYEIGIMEGTYIADLLMDASDPVLKALNKRIKTFPAWNNDEYGDSDVVHNLLHRKLVFLASEELQTSMSSKMCHLKQVKGRLTSQHSAFGLPRFSPLAHLLSEYVTSLRERGIFDQMDAMYAPKPKRCDTPPKLPQQNIDSIKTLLLTLVGCILIAFLVLMLERRKQHVYNMNVE